MTTARHQIAAAPAAGPRRPAAPRLEPLLTAGRTLATLALLCVPLPATLAVTAVALTTDALATLTSSRRAPSRRAPSGRAPSGRAPSGRAPSGRAPSRRAPSRRAPSRRAPSRRAPSRPAPMLPAAPSRTVLLNGGKMTKALALARAFSRAGHRVVLVESGKYRWTGHRWSRAVDRFYPVPEPNAPDYARALRRIVEREKVDVYVPVSSPAGSRYDARTVGLLGPACEVFSVGPDLVEVLDDKHRFAELAAGLGLSVAASHRITRAEQLDDLDMTGSPHGYLLKSIDYDPTGRLDPVRLTGRDPAGDAALVRDLPISERQPWVLQEFLVGQEYCAHATVRRGHLQVYACCPSSAVQLNYTHVDVPQIEQWVRRFAEQLHLTGQVAFDFIRTADGQVHAIECNPRTHSAITLFYDHPDLADAYLQDRSDCLTPLPSSRPTYWLYHEVWRLLRDPLSLPRRLAILARGKDAVFDWSDPLPFLLLHHLQVPALLLQALRRGRRWIRIDVNIGKLVEVGGD